MPHLLEAAAIEPASSAAAAPPFANAVEDLFAAYQCGRRQARGGRLGAFLDAIVFKDSPEYLERPDLPWEERLRVMLALQRLERRCGYQRAFLKEVDRLLGAAPASRRPLRIMDVGAGTGGLMRAVARRLRASGVAFELWGADTSQENLDYNAAQCRKENIPCRLFRADARRLGEVADLSVDFVLSSYMVHHIREAGGVAQFLAETYRVARRGWLIVDFDRTLLGPWLFGCCATLFGSPCPLIADTVRSARRAYKRSEIAFLLRCLEREGRICGMEVRGHPLLPYWVIRGHRTAGDKS